MYEKDLYIDYLIVRNSSNNEKVWISVDDIICIECYGHDVEVHNKSEIRGYLSVYSLDHNPGYSKYVEIKGDIIFTYFIRDDKYDTYHPSFLIFVQYTGEKDVKNYGYHGTFLTYTGEVIGGFGASGGGHG